MNKLEARQLEKRFGRRLLFSSLGFTLEGGGSLAITGANGSGKSTLLRIIAGVLTPSFGQVDLYINGTKLSSESHRLAVGLVAPYMNVYDGFTPRENLQFIARARRLPGKETSIDEVLQLVALDRRADDPVATFSSGLKQRVKFAVALLVNPALLLLDEPRVNLDAAGLEMVKRITRRQRERGHLLVVATNDEREAEEHDELLQIEDYR